MAVGIERGEAARSVVSVGIVEGVESSRGLKLSQPREDAVQGTSSGGVARTVVENDGDTGGDGSRIQHGKRESQVARHRSSTAATLAGESATGFARLGPLTRGIEAEARREDPSDRRRAVRANDLVGMPTADTLGQVGLAPVRV
jgi:hypothetical protein